MMNCREAAKILGRQTSAMAEETTRQAREHLTDCAHCRRRWGLERLAVALIRAHAADRTGEPLFPSPYFFTRLRARINAVPAEASTTFWEAAVATANGWLLAFGSVTAILLAAFIFTWHSGEAGTELNSYTLALPDSSANIVLAAHEPLSRDAVLELFADEDYDHARK